MPKAWLSHCSALVFSIFFPWFPIVPPQVPEAEQPAVAAPAPEEAVVLPGVVIEEIPKGSALEKAGLQVGDVILSWERLPNPPANPEGARGELSSYFDWLELKVEQVPRGVLVLSGRRGDEPLELRVEPGLWEAKVRPVVPPSLEEIYLAGKTQIATGDFGAAVGVWRKLADEAGATDRNDFRAWIALRLGEAWGERSEWGKTVEASREALEASTKPSVQAAAWTALGEAHERLSEYDEAEQAYGTALQAYQKIRPISLGEAAILNRLGEVAWSRDALDRAEDYFMRGLRMREQLAPQSLDVAESLVHLGMTFRARGDLAHAHDYYHQGLAIQLRLSPFSLVVANSLNSLGVLAQNRGDLDRADEYHHRSLQIKEQLAPDSLTVAYSLNNLGTVAHDRGELDRARDYHLRALQIRERLAPHSLEVANSLNNLGAVTHARGELARALDYYLQALRIRKQLVPQSLAMARSLSNLGALARDRGDLDDAFNYNFQALQLFEQFAPKSLLAATTLYNLGALAQDRSELDRAQDYHSQSLEIRNRLAPRSLAVALSLTNMGEVALSRKDLDLAQSYYLQSLEILESLALETREMAMVLSYLGDIAQARGLFDRAGNLYDRALDLLEHHVSRLGGSYNVQADFRTQHSTYYRLVRDILLAQGRFAEAFHGLERFRARTFLTMLAERDTAFTADIPEDLDRKRRQLSVQYDRTLQKLGDLNSRDHREEIEVTRRELQKLENEAGDIEARIRRESPRLAALTYPQPLETAQAQQTLDPGTLLLSYSVGKEKTALFVLSRSGDLEVKVLPVGEAVLRSQVKQLLSLIPEAALGSSLGTLRQNRFQAAGRELYTTLLGPVSERVAASERLLILPDGPLHALPFAALVREKGQYLAEWKPLHVALSATVFAELKQRRRPAGGSDAFPIQLAAFGDPVYPQSLKKRETQGDISHRDPVVRSAAERGIFDWQPLPHTRREVEGIARLFPAGAARTFVGSEALEERIKSLDPKTRILHLAAHGHTDEHLPSSSFVALTIPEDTNSDAAASDRDNGLLQVWEIFERVRLDADLVVLSACETALGEEQGGEGLIGLTRAFQYAGARTVMASLWSVQDQATSELMIRFYKHLRAGLPKDEALRQAQVELIRGPIEVVNEKGEKTFLDASSPYFWAGFQLYGDWQ